MVISITCYGTVHHESYGEMSLTSLCIAMYDADRNRLKYTLAKQYSFKMCSVTFNSQLVIWKKRVNYIVSAICQVCQNKLVMNIISKVTHSSYLIIESVVRGQWDLGWWSCNNMTLSFLKKNVQVHTDIRVTYLVRMTFISKMIQTEPRIIFYTYISNNISTCSIY